MSTRGDIVEAILFLPAMALLAAVIGGGLYAIYLLGWYAAHGWYWLLWQQLGLWKPLALTLTTFATALTVYAVVMRLIPALIDRAQSAWDRRRKRV